MEEHMTFKLTSTGFDPQAEMPLKYTADGPNVSPPLAWSGAPEQAKTFALVIDDPDAPDPAAPRTRWVHWVLYNLPPAATSLPEAVSRQQLPAGTREGRNDWNSTGYRGPAPPIGRHRYVHTVYALDVVLPDLHDPTRAELEKAMAGHILAKAELVATYARRA
jgi:Raf kinase inhibitor-like YbhB/YbcL family protein